MREADGATRLSTAYAIVVVLVLVPVVEGSCEFEPDHEQEYE